MNRNKKKKIILFGILGLLGVIFLLVFTIFQISKPPRIAEVPSNVCTADSASCSWTSTGATSYDYKIIDTSTNTPIKQDTTTATSVTFTPEAGKTYRCEVIAKNSCGNSSTGIGTGTCGVEPTPTTPQPTPTTPPEITPTPASPPEATPTPTPLPVVCNGPCVKNSQCATPFICYTGKCRLPASLNSTTCELIPTPTPTLIPTATPTPTPKPTATPIPTPTAIPTQPPVVNNPPPVVNNPPIVQNPIIPTTPPVKPTIAPSGSLGNTLGIIGITVLTVMGGAILLLL